jgi:hypothetical protein
VLDVQTVPVENVSFSVPINGDFYLQLNTSNNTVHVSAYVDAYLADLRNKFLSLVQSTLAVNDECGERFHVNRADMYLSGSNAGVSANATYEKWLCTSATVPQVKCEDTWIKVGPLKTKGIPKCSTWMGTVQTMKTKLFQQSGDIYMTIRPTVQGGTTIRIDPTVDSVHLDGFGQSVASLLHVNMKNVAQNMLSRAIDPNMLSIAVPNDLSSYVSFQSAEFYSAGGLGLRLKAHGEFDVTSDQILSLCSRFWPAGQCSKK